MKKLVSLLMACLLTGACAPVWAVEEEKVLDGSVLVTFGASNTALSSWPMDVAEELNMHLVNSGIGGNNTGHGKVRFQRDVLAYNPDFVTICFGTNDFNRQGSGQPQVSPEEYRENLVYFITELEKIDALPILVTSPIIDPNACGGASLYPEGSVNEALDVYVDIVRSLAEEYDLPLIDIHQICDQQYTVAEFLISDGVHLTELANSVFAQEICKYLKAHYRQDPTAPRVDRPVPPEMQEAPFSSSIMPFDPAGWLEIYPDTLVMIKEASGAISFANTTGLWPEAHYSPSLDKTLPVPVRGSYLTVDIQLEAAMNLLLFFNGATPTLGYDGDYLPMTPVFKKYVPGLQTTGDDIKGGQRIQCVLPLEEIIPVGMMDDNGCVLFSGVKLYVVGTAGKKITVNKLEVTAVDPATLPPLPTYEYGADLMPDSRDKITPAQGVAGVEYHQDGSFALSRDASSSIAWPSVKVQVDKEIDLAATPLLHLKVLMDKGCANGHLYYTLADGSKGNVQLSMLVNKTVNDFTSDIDLYADLAAYLGTEEVITVNYLTLSVYGNVGDSLTWKAIRAAKLIPVENPPQEDEPQESQPEESAPESTAPGSTEENISENTSAEASRPTEEPATEGGFLLWAILAGMVLVAVVCITVIWTRRKA